MTIIGEDKSLSRQASGDEKVDLEFYGSPATNAEAQCFRRCMSKFGVARHLSKKDKKHTASGKFSSAKEWSQKQINRSSFPIKTDKSQPKSKNEISREEWLRKFGNKN